MKEEVFKLIREVSEHEGVIENQMCLYDDIGIDSLSIVDLISEVEKSLGVSFLDSEVEGVKTVEHLLKAVETKLNK